MNPDSEWSSLPIGHILMLSWVLCVLDRTNVGLIPLATVDASKRLPSDMYLISCIFYKDNNYCKLCAFVM